MSDDKGGIALRGLRIGREGDGTGGAGGFKFTQPHCPPPLAPKTGNEYLTLAMAFLNWLERNQRVGFNPLRRVVKAETRGKERPKRRALTRVQADQLAASTGRRGLAYRLACYTGLRQGELQQLRWVDMNLDTPKP